ncbi:MAG: DNA translocase FtsK 4TM domain-containing protein [Cytophagales bacterium]|nr:DNA translocase FtsK [Bernardetiaceae bacterium]MDW8210347.1 DNA translocase FtsK 4TM domain-containing protein [Cytophagales bacterium]
MAVKRNLYKKKKSGGLGRLIQISSAIANFFQDKRFFVTLGLLMIGFAIALLLSLISYFSTGEADQSLVESWNNSSGSQGLARNWLGRFGAVLSYYFMYRWFGIASFLFVPIFLNAGLKLAFRRSLFTSWQSTKVFTFFLFWLSTSFGYLVLITETESQYSFLCGAIGYSFAQGLHYFMGWAAPLFLLLCFVVFMVYSFDLETLLHFRQKTQHTTQQIRDKAAPAAEKNPNSSNLSEVFNNPLQNKSPKTQKNTPNEASTIIHQNNAATPLEIELKPSQELASAEEEEEKEEEANTPEVPAYIRYGLYDPTLELSSYKYPTVDLLDPPEVSKVRVTKEELEQNKDKIVETLSNFRIGISSIKATIGPTVTLYEIVPQAGVKISRIKTLEDDIALSLSALGIRIIAPIPGRGTIGIEVPNKNREIVRMSSIITHEKFVHSDKALPIVLGKTISNEVFVTDLAKMPHLLMAGATGQGKSVGLNVILTSLLYKKHPAELKFVLVDPKKVELTLFNRIERHFLATLPNAEEPIITDTRKVIHTLNSLCIEMDVRYNLLKEAGCRNIKEYNQKFRQRMLNPQEGHRFLPYIVLIIDELADLMMTAGKEVETPIARLAQLARAIGIHLVVATQRPSVNVITGIIKANFPARLSFKVSSRVDSRTILDCNGAEQLVGQGDMLLSNGSDVIRLQCAFIDTHEVERICEFIGEQRGYDTSYLLPEYEDEGAETKTIDLNNRDAMFEEAARLVVAHQQGSTSLIQRKLSLGYNRAGRIMDQLEAAGVVGPFEGSKARKVLIQDQEALEQLLKSLS